MCVIFHTMGRRVADFWPAVSFGLLGYRIDRTHSIMARGRVPSLCRVASRCMTLAFHLFRAHDGFRGFRQVSSLPTSGSFHRAHAFYYQNKYYYQPFILSK